MDTNKLQTKISDIERELMDLKTVQGPIINVTAYHYDYDFNFTLDNNLFTINFIKSDEPLILIADMNDVFTPIPLALVGNKQYYATGMFTSHVRFYSNWEITGVTEL